MNISRSLLLLVLTGLLTACAGLSVEDVYQSPSFSHQDTQLTGMTWTTLSGRSRVELDNPNPFGVPISKLAAELWLDGEPWLNLGAPQLNGLAANASTELDFDWRITIPGLMERARDAYRSGAADLELRLVSTLDVPVIGSRQLDWQHAFTVPVPRAPSVRLADWRVEDLSLSNITLSLDLQITNPNRFELAAGPWTIQANASGRQVSTLSLGQVSLPADNSQTHRTKVTLDFADLGPSLINTLRSRQWPSNMTLDWRGDMASPDLGLDLPALEGEVSL